MQYTDLQHTRITAAVSSHLRKSPQFDVVFGELTAAFDGDARKAARAFYRALSEHHEAEVEFQAAERIALFGESGADAPCGDGGTDVGAAMWTISDGTQIPVAAMTIKHILRAIDRVENFNFNRMTLEEHEACVKSLRPLCDELRRRGLEVPWSYFRAQNDLRERIRVEEGR